MTQKPISDKDSTPKEKPSTPQYDKFYAKLRQATHVKFIVNSEEQTHQLHDTTKIIYTFLLQRFEAGESKFRYLSMDRIAAECGLSSRTVSRKVADLTKWGIVEVDSKRSMLTGRNTTNYYTKVVNLLNSNKYKLFSQSMKDYHSQLQEKQERLNSLRDYIKVNLRGEYKKDWTETQFYNFFRNTMHELVTGEYFTTEDKSARLHYKLDFSYEDLEDFEARILYQDIKEDNKDE